MQTRIQGFPGVQEGPAAPRALARPAMECPESYVCLTAFPPLLSLA